jgi:hypothetical protein
MFHNHPKRLGLPAMAWTKGQSGNPLGRASEKEFANALRAVSNQIDPKTKRKNLLLVAEKLVEQAIAGEGWAIQQFADRLDGKPAQESTVNVRNQSLTELADAEIAARIEQLRAGRAGSVRGDGETSLDSSQFN